MIATRTTLLAAAASIALSASAAAQAPTPSAAAPKPAAAASSPEALVAGKALLAKVVAWLGGPAKVSGVKDVQTKGQLTAKTPEGDATMEVESAMVFPDRLFQQIDSPYGRVGMVVTSSSGFLFGTNGSQDLPPLIRGELLKQVQRIPLNLARKAADPKLQASAAGTAKIGDIEAQMLDIRFEEIAVRWYVDPATGRILRTEHTTTTPEGQPAQMVSDYSDYKSVDGYPVAHRLEVTTNGQKDQTLILEECRINAGVNPKLFERPVPAPPPPPAP